VVVSPLLSKPPVPLMSRSSSVPEPGTTSQFAREPVPLKVPLIRSTKVPDLDDIVDRYEIGKRNLQKLFREYIGVTPKWVIQRYRLHEAAERLDTASTDLSTASQQPRLWTPSATSWVLCTIRTISSRMRPDATAFVHRGELFQLKHSVVIDAEAATREQEAAHGWVSRSWALLHPFASGRVFPNFADPELEDWASAYYGPNSWK
jgi:AraC-like DNA-binding protein